MDDRHEDAESLVLLPSNSKLALSVRLTEDGVLQD